MEDKNCTLQNRIFNLYIFLPLHFLAIMGQYGEKDHFLSQRRTFRRRRARQATVLGCRQFSSSVNTCLNVKQVDAEMSLALKGKKDPILNQNQANKIKEGANPPCSFSRPISGLSFISGPWWGCHVYRPTSYYDNGSRGSTC